MTRRFDHRHRSSERHHCPACDMARGPRGSGRAFVGNVVHRSARAGLRPRTISTKLRCRCGAAGGLLGARAIARAEDDGALLRLEACPEPIRGTRDAAVPDEDLDAEIVGAARVAADLLGRVPWCRTSWTRIEFALGGTREALGERATSLLVHLGAQQRLVVASHPHPRLSW